MLVTLSFRHVPGPFLRAADDTILLTVLVAKLYPSRPVFAVPCANKGVDPYVTSRLSKWLLNSGVTEMTHMCDQESALATMIDDVLERIKASGMWVGAVPEHSAVGSSQSNGRAERSVQMVEDMVRCFKGELEARINARIPSEHAILKWLVEYVSVVLTKYHINDDNTTAYEALHGHRADEKLAYFREKSVFLDPNPTPRQA